MQRNNDGDDVFAVLAVKNKIRKCYFRGLMVHHILAGGVRR
jgi:hypothetical protein